MVFQSYALYPHMSVRQNLGYGLKVRRTPKAGDRGAASRRSRRCSTSTELLERKPAQLSGGQRQRVAMGRAIVRQPQAFLMDEPLSNLDAKLRVGMRASLAQLHQQLGVTTVYVTHDQVEAMTLGQRVAVMRDGRILQVDTPQTLYEQPRDLFVAGFIGSPAMNLVEARIDGDEVVARPVPDPARRGSAPGPRSRAVIVGIRPETFEDAGFASRGAADDRRRRRGARGARLRCARVLPGRRDPRSPSGLDEDADEATDLVTDRGALLNARVDPRTSARVGDTIRLAVDPVPVPLLRRRDGRIAARAWPCGPR